MTEFLKSAAVFLFTNCCLRQIRKNLIFIIFVMSLSTIIKKSSNNSGIPVYVNTYESPVGKAITAADNEFLYIVTFEDSKNFEKSFETLAKELSCKFIEGENKLLQKLKEELENYFDGKLKKFTVPIKTYGSDFQKVNSISLTVILNFYSLS